MIDLADEFKTHSIFDTHETPKLTRPGRSGTLVLLDYRKIFLEATGKAPIEQPQPHGIKHMFFPAGTQLTLHSHPEGAQLKTLISGQISYTNGQKSGNNGKQILRPGQIAIVTPDKFYDGEILEDSHMILEGPFYLKP